MLNSYTIAALIMLVVSCAVYAGTRRRGTTDEPHIPASWHDDRIEPVDWLGDYPGRPPPSIDRIHYRPRHGSFVGVNVYWAATAAYRAVTKRPPWRRIFTPVQVRFAGFRRPPSRLGHWRVEGGVQ
jgi:hypothetical protein